MLAVLSKNGPRKVWSKASKTYLHPMSSSGHSTGQRTVGRVWESLLVKAASLIPPVDQTTMLIQ